MEAACPVLELGRKNVVASNYSLRGSTDSCQRKSNPDGGCNKGLRDADLNVG